MLKKYIIILSAFLCVLLIPSNWTLAADSDVIENNEAGIPNEELYQEILDTLNKKIGETFTKGEAKGIERLYLDVSNDDNLKGIGHLSALKHLELNYCEPVKINQNLRGIEELTGLKELYIEGNLKIQMKNLDSLKGLTGLEVLSVTQGNIRSLHGIKGLVNLRCLAMECNQLKNLDGIQYLKNLETLFAQSNSLSSLKGIESLKKLDVLDVRYNDISSIKELRGLKNLTRIYLTDNYLKNADPLKNLTKLTVLYLERNLISRLPNMKRLTKLFYLDTEFVGNRLSEKELTKKLPAHLLKKKGWLKRQKESQKINGNNNIRISMPRNRKVTASTKRIEGYVSKKWEAVRLVNLSWIKDEVYIDDCYIQSVKPDKDGHFVMKGLKLAKYKGNKLRIYLNGACPTKFQFVVR